MTSYLYFFSSGDRIKIGVSTNVERRRKDVGAQLPQVPSCLGFIEGDYSLERYVHGLLAEYRLSGEWFSDTPRVREVLTVLLEKGPSAINYKGRPPRPPSAFVPTAPTEENRRKALHLALSSLWPENTAERLAEYAEVDLTTAEAWLAGEEEIPRLVMNALGFELMQFFMAVRRE